MFRRQSWNRTCTSKRFSTASACARFCTYNTPKRIRLRKVHLDPHERKKAILAKAA